MALGLVAAGCAGATGGTGAAGAQPATSAAADVASPPPTTWSTDPPPVLGTDSSNVATPPWVPTTTVPDQLQPVPRSCTPPPAEFSNPPPWVRDALEPHLRDPRWLGNTASISVWIDGWGEVAALNPDVALAPASNQKVLVAAGLLAGLDPSTRLHTDLVATGPVVDGVVRGDLVLVAGGDPALLQSGIDSLEALAAQLSARGIVGVDGKLLVDEGRYDDVRTAPGWPEGQWPLSIGPLSALVIGRNTYGADAAFLRDPSLSGIEVFRSVLRAHGIEVSGPSGYGSGKSGEVIATTSSPPISELVRTMLHRSDNLIAELAVKELAFRQLGRSGTTADGLAVIHQLLEERCIPADGADIDGSGLSRNNARSARSWRRLLQAVTGQPWWPTLYSSLPVAGQNGTLGTRLLGPSTAGNVRAKTGMIIQARSMSGYLTTAGGRRAVFSIIVNGPNLGHAEAAIDALVTTVAELPG